MPQLHLYVPEETAQRLRSRAKASNLSLSRYLAEIVGREVADGWPDGYFEDVVGGWSGEPLERPGQLELEERSGL